MCRHQGHQQRHHHEHHGHPGQHSHHHDAPHPGSHAQPKESTWTEAPAVPLTPLEKLSKMVEHWLHHNEDHARSFSDWAVRARELDQAEVAACLEDVARQSLLQNDPLQRALDLLKSAAGKTP